MVSLAMASAGWAAISAVGGALVGATAGGIVDYLLRQASEKRLATTGARLVAADLKRSDGHLQGMVESGKWTETARIPASNWLEYRAVLAGRLDGGAFEGVARIMIALDDLSYVRERPGVKPGQEVQLPAETIKDIETLRTNLTSTYNALADLGGLKRVTGHLASRPSLKRDAEA